ncbi:hypothetical protein Taro_011302 [Colocasia esculenta]|uniref:Peptidase M24 domain-containing protein n=1 Tax=Colocasia esculenta TaxID=4460 RepID=A0A843U5W5_COLES|nr:hypothetical protein [Colocasia esculenta]
MKTLCRRKKKKPVMGENPADLRESVSPLFPSVKPVTQDCLEKAISVCKDGASFKKIGKRIRHENGDDGCQGKTINSMIPSRHLGTLYMDGLRGSTMGKLKLRTGNDKPGHMVEGQTFTIEPILTMGSIDCVTWDDGWTTLTADGSMAAQFEHTLLITRTGAEILTKC